MTASDNAFKMWRRARRMSQLTLFDTVILGILQGLAEWLPVSSKSFGLFYLLGFVRVEDASLAFSMSIWLHLGSFLAALFLFRSQVLMALRAMFGGGNQGRPILQYLVVATLASGAVGVPLYFVTKGVFSQNTGQMVMVFTGALMLVTATVLFFTPRLRGDRVTGDVRLSDSVGIGSAQGLAAIPGMSRSGLTIFSAALLKFNGEASTSLSFLLGVIGVPAIALFDLVSGAGASGLEAIQAIGLGNLAVAIIVSFAVSLLAIEFLMELSRRVNLSVFVAAVGLLAIFLNLPLLLQ